MGLTRSKTTRGGFSIASSLPRTAGLVDHVDDVLSQLREPAAIKRIAPPTERVELSCALYLAPGERPEIGLRPDQLAVLAWLGAAFDIDLYPDYLTQ